MRLGNAARGPAVRVGTSHYIETRRNRRQITDFVPQELQIGSRQPYSVLSLTCVRYCWNAFGRIASWPEGAANRTRQHACCRSGRTIAESLCALARRCSPIACGRRSPESGGSAASTQPLPVVYASLLGAQTRMGLEIVASALISTIAAEFRDCTELAVVSGRR